MKWKIIADSSCDLRRSDISYEEVEFSTIPFILQIGATEYIDDELLDIEKMITDMEKCSTISHSACPSPEAWVKEFRESDYSIAVTISSNLSGSYNSAVVAREIVLAEFPNKKIAVLDSRSTGPESAMCIMKIAKLIKEGEEFDSIVKSAQELFDKTSTAFALCSFDNLVKNGRMSRLTGFVARKLGMWGIGAASNIGTIIMRGKSRGMEKAINVIIEEMKEKRFVGGKVIISHCFNEICAQKIKEAIIKMWGSASVLILKTRGLDSFYAERGGVIVAF